MKVAQLCPTLQLYSPQNSPAEYCSGWSFPSPGDRPKPGIEPRSSTLQADALPPEPPGKPIRTNARAEDGITLTQTVYLKKREKWFLKEVSSIVIKKEWE